MADYTGKAASEAVDHHGDTTDKSWDFSQGGIDTLTAGSGNDSFFMGSQLTTADRIDGGDGDDTLELAGNYFQHTVIFNGHPVVEPFQLVFGPSTVTHVQTIKLDQGAGFGYDLKFDAQTFFPDGTIDGSSLTTAGETIDGSAATVDLNFVTGTGAYDLTAGSGGAFFDLRNGFAAGDSINGGSGAAIVSLDDIDDGATLSLPDVRLLNVRTFILAADRNYVVTAGDAQTPAHGVLTVELESQGTLNFNGAAELDGSFFVFGDDGSDTLIGGAGNDTLTGGAGTGSDSVAGGGGDDVLSSQGAGSETISGGEGNDSLNAADGSAFLSGDAGDDALQAALNNTLTTRLDGGAGHDQAFLQISPNRSNTISAATLTDIEALNLIANGSLATDSCSVVWQDGVLAAGQAMPVKLFSTSTPLSFDAGAESHGSFVFTLPGLAAGVPALSLAFRGGTGNDVFIAADPSAATGAANVWDGGGGLNTLDYYGTTDGMRLDVTAGTAAGSGAVGDTFSHFQIFKFGSGNSSFTGAAGAESVFFLKPGEETAQGNAGNDVFSLGGTLDRFDAIDGGLDSDTVVLDGDYAAGLTLSSSTVRNIETLRLQHLAGEPVTGYQLITNDGNVAAGATLLVDGRQLTVGGTLTLDAAAETDGHVNLLGGAGADTLTGGHQSDTLNGEGGIDSLSGGLGNDSYFVDSAADKVTEAAGGGADTVFAAVSYALQAGQSVELLATDSQAGTGALHLVGNALMQAIRGNNGDNQLTAGGGADSLFGFAGNDGYVVDDASERVFESAGQGADTVFAAATYALQKGQSVELLATTSRAGTTQITLTGNEQAQRIDGNNGINGVYGGDGNDTLNGFDGNDRLGGGNGRDLIDGGAGNDIFAYSAVVQSSGVNRDLISHINFSQDKFDLPAVPTGIDAKVTGGTLNEGAFDANLASALGATKLLAHHAVLFDPSAGTADHGANLYLVVDVNGTAGYQAGADYVFELANATGTLVAGDFI